MPTPDFQLTPEVRAMALARIRQLTKVLTGQVLSEEEGNALFDAMLKKVKQAMTEVPAK